MIEGPPVRPARRIDADVVRETHRSYANLPRGGPGRGGRRAPPRPGWMPVSVPWPLRGLRAVPAYSQIQPESTHATEQAALHRLACWGFVQGPQVGSS